MTEHGSPGYFQQLSQALDTVACARPVLVIDKARLDYNIAQLQQVLRRGFSFRLVAKSLPSLPLLDYVLRQTDSQRLMCFHMPFLLQVLRYFDQADVMLGKPMPVTALGYFERDAAAADVAVQARYDRVQWLVDTPERLLEYEAFARKHQRNLRICLEIDVGLHRGGFQADTAFKSVLRHLADSEHLRLAGLMGYEAHITKIPALFGGPKAAEGEAKASYQRFVQLVRSDYGDVDGLCLNVGGSTTYPLYQQEDLTFCNEIATASALVKPSDFDVFTLSHHQAAAWIATPVLKVMQQPDLPGPPALSRLLRTLGVLPQQACFTYGGNWLADPVFPAQARRVKLFGHSSNQEMHSLPQDAGMKPGDWLYLRPMQSEAVLLQFGDIAVYENGQITEWWPVLDYPTRLDAPAQEAPL
ncbi:MAG: alanine racemase [Salinisphaeraceae bacterium]|nr:alanine racemase [Salinisphaeraceae bacterium]